MAPLLSCSRKSTHWGLVIVFFWSAGNESSRFAVSVKSSWRALAAGLPGFSLPIAYWTATLAMLFVGSAATFEVSA